MKQTKPNKNHEKIVKISQKMEVYTFSQESVCAKHELLFFIVGHSYLYFSIT